MQSTGHMSPQIVDVSGQPVQQFYFASMPQQYTGGVPTPGFYSQSDHTPYVQPQNGHVMFSSMGQPMVFLPPQTAQIPFGVPHPGAYFSAPNQQLQTYFSGGQPHEVVYHQQPIPSGIPPHIQQAMPPPQHRNTQGYGAHAAALPPPVSTDSTVRPLSTSTPVPAEIATIPPPMSNQMPRHDNVKSAYLNYHRNLDEDVLANLSRISTVTDYEDPNSSRQYSEHGYRGNRHLSSHRSQTGANGFTHSFKTRLCIDFKETGRCQAGFNCRFAHGMDELRPPNLTRAMMNPRYKTKMCKNVLNREYCPYGTRCEFIHPGDAEFDHVRPHMDNSAGNNGSYGSEEDPIDVTPQLPVMAPPSSVTRSAIKEHISYEHVGRRDVARSMVCLTSVGRKDTFSDLDSAIESGSSESNKTDKRNARKSCGNVRTAPSMQNLNANAHVPLKFLRRRSMSQINLNKKWNSNEEIADLVASWKVN